MASIKQIAANRANARRSTGPRTKEGKNRSRANAWKHGLTAGDIVVYHEDPRAFKALRAELWEQFDPRPGIESMLVERLAAQEWRLRRVPVLEAAALDTYCFNLTQEKTPSKSFEEIYAEVLLNSTLSPSTASAAKCSSGSTEQIKHDELDDGNKRATDQVAKGTGDQDQIEETEGDRELNPSEHLGQAVIDDARNHQVLAKLSRYEAALLSAHARTWEMLVRVQTIRQEKEERSRTIDSATAVTVADFRPKLFKPRD